MGAEEFGGNRAELQTEWDHGLRLLSRRDALAVIVGPATADRDTAIAHVQALKAEAIDQDQPLCVVIKAVQRLKARVTDA